MDADLKRHYDLGLSCSQIAAAMSMGLSRNAIIGRLHRTGINGNPPQREPTTRADREAMRLVREARGDGRRSPTRRSRVRIVPQSQPVEETLRCAPVEPLHLTLADLEPGVCRYPYGDGPYTFCGHPVAIGSYCGEHHALCLHEAHRNSGSERPDSMRRSRWAFIPRFVTMAKIDEDEAA